MKALSFVEGTFLFLLSCCLFSGCSTKSNYKPQNHVVEIVDMKFEPANLEVHVGDTVTWENKDIVAHDVTENNKKWASPPIAGGASWKKEIMENDSYYCSIHVVMKGNLKVVE